MATQWRRNNAPVSRSKWISEPEQEFDIHATSVQFLPQWWATAWVRISASLSMLTFLLALAALISPTLWTSDYRNTLYGIVLICADGGATMNVLVDTVNSTSSCRDFDEFTSGTLTDDHKLYIWLFSTGLVFLFLSAVFLSSIMCCGCCMPIPSVNLSATQFKVRLYRFTAGLHFVAGGFLMGGISLLVSKNNDVGRTLIDLKNIYNGDWSFSFYAIWISAALCWILGLVLVLASSWDVPDTVEVLQVKTSSDPKELEINTGQDRLGHYPAHAEFEGPAQLGPRTHPPLQHSFAAPAVTERACC